MTDEWPKKWSEITGTGDNNSNNLTSQYSTMNTWLDLGSFRVYEGTMYAPTNIGDHTEGSNEDSEYLWIPYDIYVENKVQESIENQIEQE